MDGLRFFSAFLMIYSRSSSERNPLSTSWIRIPGYKIDEYQNQKKYYDHLNVFI